MKKLALLVIIALAFIPALTGAAIGESVVLHLHAYIPERTTFHADEFGVVVQSNANNFTYSLTESGSDHLVRVVAR